MKHFVCLLAVSISFVVTGCNKSDNSVSFPEKEQEFGEVTVLGKKLINPYTVENMQAVSPTPIEANCLYVRFLPKNSADVYELQQLGLNLYDYPLEYEREVIGKSYHDPEIPADDITWQYAVVPFDFAFPSSVEYKVIDRCYIPGDINMERAAFEHAGYILPATKAADNGNQAAISGTLRVWNDTDKEMDPLKGVKVICRSFIKERVSYTDKEGRFSIPDDFLYGYEGSFKFDNMMDFSIWEDFRCLEAVSVDLGRQNSAN